MQKSGWESRLAEKQADRSEMMEVVRYGEKYGPAIAIIVDYAALLHSFPVQKSAGRFEHVAEKTSAIRALVDMRDVFLLLPVHEMPTVPSATYILHARKLIIEVEASLGMSRDRPYVTTGESFRSEGEKNRLIQGFIPTQFDAAWSQ